jgi:hypothetical protein
MAFGDSRVQRVLGPLQGDEVLVASVAGIEADGRRRRMIVVTDRRIRVGGFRGDAPLELSLTGATCSYDRNGALLTLRQGEDEVMLRGVDEIPARALVELLANHRPRPSHVPPSVQTSA